MEKILLEVNSEGYTEVESTMQAQIEMMKVVFCSVLSEDAKRIYLSMHARCEDVIKNYIKIRAEKNAKRGVGRPRKLSSADEESCGSFII